jgi:hypothetical protein
MSSKKAVLNWTVAFVMLLPAYIQSGTKRLCRMEIRERTGYLTFSAARHESMVWENPMAARNVLEQKKKQQFSLENPI